MEYNQKRYWIAVLSCLGYALMMLLESFFISWITQVEKDDTDAEDKSLTGTALLVQFIAPIGHLTSAYGGIVGNRYGGAVVVGITTFISASINMLSYHLERISLSLLLVVKLINAVLHALMYSSIADVWCRWSTSDHRSKYVSITIAGRYVALIITTSSLQYRLWNQQQWETILHYTAISAAIWASVWLCLVKNDPSQDHDLSDDERAVLQQRLKFLDEKGVKMNQYPWSQILKSPPFWALNAVAFAFGGGNYYIFLQLEFFLSNIASEYKVVPSAILSFFVYFCILITTFAGGDVADRIRNRNRTSDIKIVKKLICVGFVIEGLLLLVFPYEFQFVVVAALFYTLILPFRAFIEVAIHVNVIDLSPRYASFLNGVQKSFCALGVLCLMVPIRLSWVDTHELSMPLFAFVAFHFAGAALYYSYGSTEVQPWNGSSNNQRESEKSKNLPV